MNLFTFSSEPDVERTAPDRPISLLTIGFIILGLVAGFGLSYYLNSLHPGSLAKRLDEMAVLGDSTEGAAIADKFIQTKSLNISIPGSGFSAWLPAFQGVVSRVPGLQCVVVSCDPMSRLRDGLTPRDGDFSDLVLRGAYSMNLEGVSLFVRVETYLRYETCLVYVLSRPKASWAGLINWMQKSGLVKEKLQKYKYSAEQGSDKKKIVY